MIVDCRLRLYLLFKYFLEADFLRKLTLVTNCYALVSILHTKRNKNTFYSVIMISGIIHKYIVTECTTSSIKEYDTNE